MSEETIQWFVHLEMWDREFICQAYERFSEMEITEEDLVEGSFLRRFFSDRSVLRAAMKMAWDTSDVKLMSIFAHLGADLDVSYRNYMEYETPLIFAIKKNNLELVETLLRLGADPDYHDREKFHHSPLYKAVKENNVACARLLLENGADPDLDVEFFHGCASPRYETSRQKDPEMMTLFNSYPEK